MSGKKTYVTTLLRGESFILRIAAKNYSVFISMGFSGVSHCVNVVSKDQGPKHWSVILHGCKVAPFKNTEYEHMLLQILVELL